MSVQRLFLPQNDLQDKLITFIEQNAALLLTTILKKIRDSTELRHISLRKALYTSSKVIEVILKPMHSRWWVRSLHSVDETLIILIA